MTKFDLLLAPISKLPEERQEAMAIHIEPTVDEGGPTKSHEEFAAEIRSKYPG